MERGKAEADLEGHFDANYLVRDGRMWYLRRRVPKAVRTHDHRREIYVSTRTADRGAAMVVARRINSELEAYWRLLQSSGSEPDAAKRFRNAIKTARQLGLSYQSVDEVARLETAELVERVAALEQRAALSPANPAVTAVLGGVEKPVLRMSDLFEEYKALAADRLIGKSEDQIRKWANPRKRAIENFIDTIGDKTLAEITRYDALDFRSWWIDRIRDEGYDQGSANKDLTLLGTMMRTLDTDLRLGLTLPFAGVRVAGEKHNPRTPFEPDFVRTKILDGDALGAVNEEARAIVLLMAFTGMRPSEIVGLKPERIQLGAAIPHLQIRPDGRQLKTGHSRRDIPLVGRALAVISAFPEGFPRYYGRADSLSATINKALGAAGLRPTPGHTLYSLRHTFKDRLIALRVPERIQDELMGHALREVAYGQGSTLAHRAEWLAQIW